MATKLRRSNFHTDADNHVNESINAKLAANLGNISTGNITTTGYIAGPATFTIDPAAVGDNTGTLIVAGNLQVDGTTTTINSTTLEVDDLNITLASGAANATAANGAGITVDGASATITYASASDAWSFNKNVGIGGNTASATGFVRSLNLEGSDVSLQLRETTTNSSWEIGNDNTGLFRVLNNGANKLVINSTGNVGIGTSSPSTALDVTGTVTADGLTVSPSSGAAIGTVKAIAGQSAYVSIRGNNTTFLTDSFDINQLSNGSAEVMQRANHPLIIGTNNTERLRIDSSGNVGIGTSSPTNGKLEVTNASSTVPTGFFRNTSTGGDSPSLTVQGGANNAAPNFSVLDYNGNTDFVVQGAGNVGIGTSSPVYTLVVSEDGNDNIEIGAGIIQRYNRATSSYGAMNYYSASHNFYTTGGGQQSLFINSDGKVGIGASSPFDALHVEGTIRGNVSSASDENIRLTTTGGGGFVVDVDDATVANPTWSIRTFASEPLAFDIGGTERMRIDSNGRVLIGRTTTLGYKLDLLGDMRSERSAASGTHIVFTNSGGNKGTITTDAAGTTYNTTSDRRLKENIGLITDGKEKLLAMKPSTFNFIEDENKTKVHGFIAQEMRDIVPEAVSQGQEENDTWSMDYGRITPVIVAALQDALKEIDMLKNRITELEAK